MTGEQRHRNQREHRPDAKARVLRARVGAWRNTSASERICCRLRGSTPLGGAMTPLTKSAGTNYGAQVATRLGVERPQPLGPLVRHIKISAVTGLVGAESHRLPVARLVIRARIRFRVGEALGEQRPVSEVLLPLRGQCAQGCPYRLRRKIGRRAFFTQHQEPAVLPGSTSGAPPDGSHSNRSSGPEPSPHNRPDPTPATPPLGRAR